MTASTRCPVCGAENFGTRFCEQCGAPMVTSAAARATATASAPASASAMPDPKAPKTPKSPVAGRGRERFILPLAIGGGVLVLTAVAALAAIFFVIPALLASPATAAEADVADIASEPDAIWDLDYGDSSNFPATPVVAALDDEAVLLLDTLDTDAYQEANAGSSSWYEGYADDYGQGYDAGVAYGEAYEAWLEDYSGDVPYPEYSDYWPFEGSYEDSGHQGWWDGVSDGENGEELGANAAAEPTPTGLGPSLRRVDLDNGEEVWSLDLQSVFDDTDAETVYSVVPIEGSSRVAVAASSGASGGGVSSGIAVIDIGSGEVVSQMDRDAYAFITTGEGAVFAIFVTLDESSSPDGGTIERLESSDVGADATWSQDFDDVYFSIVPAGDYLLVTGNDTDGERVGDAFAMSDGERARWGDDIDASVSYAPLADGILRVETDDAGDSVLELLDLRGESVWGDELETEAHWVIDDTLVTASDNGEGYDRLSVIDAATGKDRWSGGFRDTFSAPLAIFRDTLLVAGEDGDEVVAVRLGSGEEVESYKTGSFETVLTGNDLFYVVADDELSAYGLDEGRDVWSIDVDGDGGERIMLLGRRLALDDTEKDRISLLAAG